MYLKNFQVIGMEEMIRFNVPPYVGKEEGYIAGAIQSGKICGGGQFTVKCQNMLEQMTGAEKVLLTTSGTGALEMAAILAGIQPGDEVIMPSYVRFYSERVCFARCKYCIYRHSPRHDEP